MQKVEYNPDLPTIKGGERMVEKKKVKDAPAPAPVLAAQPKHEQDIHKKDGGQ